MKICYVFSASQSVYHFMEGQLDYMNEKGVSLTIAIPDDGLFEGVVSKYPFANVVKTPIVRKVNLFQDVKSLTFFILFFIRNRFDIIHLHTPKAGLLGGLSARLCFCRNIIFHLHGLVSVQGGVLKGGITSKMEKLSFSLAHKVLSVSPSMADFCIVNKLVHRNKISVICNGSINGIDYKNKFNYVEVMDNVPLLKEELGISDKFIVGFMGRINEDKGLNDFPLVLSSLRSKFPNVHLCVVGENETDINLSSFFSSTIDYNFTLIRKVENAQDYLAMFDVLLFPSKREGFGLVLAEASALKTPSVAYDIFGVSDAIQNNVTGTLVPYGDVKGLALALEEYITNPELLRQHGNNGYTYIIEQFNRDAIWKDQFEFYVSLLKRKHI